jgi:hypothetical protein
MKTYLGAIVTFPVLLLCSCYSYSVIENPRDASCDSDIEITTTNGITFNLYPWGLDSTGTIYGLTRTRKDLDYPWKLSKEQFTLREIRSIRQRTFNGRLTRGVILGATIGVLYFTFWYFTVR